FGMVRVYLYVDVLSGFLIFYVVFQQTVASIQSTCTAAFTNTQDATDEWTSEHFVNYTDVCTHQELEQVRSMVGDVSALRSASFSLATDYSAKSTNRVSKLGNYASARAAYDAQYVANKTGTLDLGVQNVLNG